MYENLWLIPLGFAAGVLGSIVGLGGGIIAVPAMTFAGFPPALAASNSLFAAFSNSVASTISYARQKRVEFGIGIKLGLMCIPGTILGAFVSDVMTPSAFQILFAFVLIASAVYIFVKRTVDEKPYNKTALMMIFSAGASFFAGIISIILMFASLSGLLVHSALGHPDYLQAFFLAIGAFCGGILGARLSLEIKERKLKILVTIVLLAAAVKLIIDSMGVLF